MLEERQFVIFYRWLEMQLSDTSYPVQREVSGSAGATLRLTELEDLGLRAIRTIYARKDLRRARFDIWLKSAFSWVHHIYGRVY